MEYFCWWAFDRKKRRGEDVEREAYKVVVGM
jgi:hypothetical protein